MHASSVTPRPREPFAGPLRCGPTRPAPDRPGRGFSIIELVIVLAIVAVVAAIAVPRYQLATARYRAVGAARRIASDIQALRQEAVTRSLGQRLRIRNATTYQITDNAAGWGAASVRSIDLASDPYRARFTSTDLGNDSELLFNGFGLPDGAASMTISVGAVTAQVSVDGQTGAVTARLASITAPTLGNN